MKKIILFIVTFFLNSIVLAQSWSEIISDYANDIDYKIIKEQYECFINNNAPTIVNPVIKNIPIADKGEPLIDLYALNNKRITMLPSPKIPFFGSQYNSGLTSASKMRKEIYLRLEKMINYLDDLSELFGYKFGQVSIKLFEGLRDLKTQEKLFEDKLYEIKLNNPHLTDEEAELEAAKWVSPVKNNVPVHSTGAAVDIRLWNEKTQSFIDLGKFGVIWGDNKEAQTFSENITDAQKMNRLYLLMAATKAELVNYTYEHWHFSYGDRYAAYWQEKDVDKRVACYGAVNIQY